VALAFDLGKQMRFKAGEIFNEGWKDSWIGGEFTIRSVKVCG
jgi:hypothetical protein